LDVAFGTKKKVEFYNKWHCLVISDAEKVLIVGLFFMRGKWIKKAIHLRSLPRIFSVTPEAASGGIPPYPILA
jgi:hypothetical protein